METLHFTIHINAPREKVWEAMLTDKTYREWTSAFHPGSYFEGSWDEGSKILFLGPDDKGGNGGMVSRIAKSVPNEFVSIEHLGVVQNGEEVTSGEAVKGWAGAHENYTFKDKDGGTELLIDLDIQPSYKEMMAGIWPKALAKLKEIAER